MCTTRSRTTGPLEPADSHFREGKVAKNTESGFAALCLFYSLRESLAALSLCYFCQVGRVCRVL